MRTTIFALLLALAVTPAAAQQSWADNGDGTWTLRLTKADRKIMLEASRYALTRRAFDCTQNRIDDGDCPQEALGAMFPRRGNIDCESGDVPARCASFGDGETWQADLVRCGDGTFNGGTGTGSDFDYDKFPGGKVNDALEYDVACKSKWKNRGFWLPTLPHSRIILRRQYRDFGDNLRVGDGKGEDRVLAQGDEPREEAP